MNPYFSPVEVPIEPAEAIYGLSFSRDATTNQSVSDCCDRSAFLFDRPLPWARLLRGKPFGPPQHHWLSEPMHGSEQQHVCQLWGYAAHPVEQPVVLSHGSLRSTEQLIRPLGSRSSPKRGGSVRVAPQHTSRNGRPSFEDFGWLYAPRPGLALIYLAQPRRPEAQPDLQDACGGSAQGEQRPQHRLAAEHVVCSQSLERERLTNGELATPSQRRTFFRSQILMLEWATK